MKITHDCPFQIDLKDGSTVCGKITDMNVPCIDMLDWRACGNYPWHERNELIEEFIRKNYPDLYAEYMRKNETV